MLRNSALAVIAKATTVFTSLIAIYLFSKMYDATSIAIWMLILNVSGYITLVDLGTGSSALNQLIGSKNQKEQSQQISISFIINVLFSPTEIALS